MKVPVMSMGEAAKGVVVEIKLTGARRFRFRLWLAKTIIRIAAFVSPMDIEIVNTDD